MGLGSGPRGTGIDLYGGRLFQEVNQMQQEMGNKWTQQSAGSKACSGTQNRFEIQSVYMASNMPQDEVRCTSQYSHQFESASCRGVTG